MTRSDDRRHQSTFGVWYRHRFSPVVTTDERRRRRHLGLCVDCAREAMPERSRCELCAERNREIQRLNYQHKKGLR